MTTKSITDITVVWTNRRQNLKQSTEDIIIFLERLKKFDARFNTWHKKGSSRKEAMQNKVKLEYETIKKIICEKCNDDQYPEFSFLVGFWNGAKTESLSYSIRFSIGGDSKIGTNNCTLSLPREGDLFKSYSNKENWRKLLNLFIDHWNPEKIRTLEDELIEL